MSANTLYQQIADRADTACFGLDVIDGIARLWFAGQLEPFLITEGTSVTVEMPLPDTLTLKIIVWRD